MHFSQGEMQKTGALYISQSAITNQAIAKQAVFSLSY